MLSVIKKGLVGLGVLVVAALIISTVIAILVIFHVVTVPFFAIASVYVAIGSTTSLIGAYLLEKKLNIIEKIGQFFGLNKKDVAPKPDDHLPANIVVNVNPASAETTKLTSELQQRLAQQEKEIETLQQALANSQEQSTALISQLDTTRAILHGTTKEVERAKERTAEICARTHREFLQAQSHFIETIFTISKLLEKSGKIDEGIIGAITNASSIKTNTHRFRIDLLEQRSNALFTNPDGTRVQNDAKQRILEAQYNEAEKNILNLDVEITTLSQPEKQSTASGEIGRYLTLKCKVDDFFSAINQFLAALLCNARSSCALKSITPQKKSMELLAQLPERELPKQQSTKALIAGTSQAGIFSSPAGHTPTEPKRRNSLPTSPSRPRPSKPAK